MTPTASSNTGYRQFLGQAITSPTAASAWPQSFYYTFSPSTTDTTITGLVDPTVGGDCTSNPNPYSCYPTSGQCYYNYFLPGQSEGERIFATSPEPRHSYPFQQTTPTMVQRSKSQAQYILGGGFPNTLSGGDASEREDALYSDCDVMDINTQESKELTVSVSDHEMALKNGARVIASYEAEEREDEFGRKLKEMKCEMETDSQEPIDPFLAINKTIPIPENVDPSKIIHQNENVCVLTNDFVDDENMSLSCMVNKKK